MLRFEWDPAKSRTNLRKHGIAFEDALHVFADPFALAAQDREVDGELRWQTIGLAAGVVLVLVAHTVRDVGADEIIRIISARKATRKECTRYEQSRSQESE